MTATQIPRFASKHWKGTDGAHHVETDLYLEATLAVDHALEAQGLVLFAGPPGTGKSEILKTIIEGIALPWSFLPVGPEPTGKSVEVALLGELYRQKDPPETVNRALYRSELRRRLATELAVERLVGIDDFDPSGRAGTEVIRYCFEQPTNRATFVIVCNDARRLERADPAFFSRIMRVVRFGRIPAEQVVATMQAYHDFFRRSAPELIRRVDTEHARGNFRAWAIFLATALTFAADLKVDALTPDLIKVVYAAVNKRAPAAEEAA